MPIACRQHDAVERVVTRNPAKLAADLRSIGVKRGRIAFATLGELMRDRAAEDATDARDDVFDRRRRARAEVIDCLLYTSDAADE